ncbi:hypothetical protein CHELA1G11_10200 [Hyphomicrobiales bacterium]|nr:hypothetical protein CHELA1G11_10200 [Hyphomicrobiales bacterium]CAH1676350.1 hypothetical protein CHELA1G2_14107 [Hyphomicrobiales bacterium]
MSSTASQNDRPATAVAIYCANCITIMPAIGCSQPAYSILSPRRRNDSGIESRFNALQSDCLSSLSRVPRPSKKGAQPGAPRVWELKSSRCIQATIGSGLLNPRPRRRGAATA